eukprot:CAMPEP_0202859796 /NCGR_PEP_ID=MMETSP1391-20130828/1765_1 /ASSEMBLY_ACC=CAM_ASM_000867 /TAXON_ID=1034604 /ORGANISM="Chlamydomonas leiostraca, Strain SAG 11-49" /LENGTH=178 /DNA_ID=CAMNT_0049538879 /DNA_START=187 /DNA_END=723 /DNA_ORIENTATION=-
MKTDEREAALRDLKGMNKPAGQFAEPAYVNGAAFLKQMGISNPAEIARILDIAMNPNSMFIDHSLRKGGKNVSARLLDVDKDMMPVFGFFQDQGMSKGDILRVIAGHPPVLCYTVEARLAPFYAYMKEIGIQDVNAVVAGRPSLLGLDVDMNLRKIVDYLVYTETPLEKIVEYISKSI